MLPVLGRVILGSDGVRTGRLGTEIASIAGDDRARIARLLTPGRGSSWAADILR
jgi:hypothetical protein